jgi:hypothetical protein
MHVYMHVATRQVESRDAAPIETEGGFRVTGQRALFRLSPGIVGTTQQAMNSDFWHITPDDQPFLIARNFRNDEEGFVGLGMVTNFHEILKVRFTYDLQVGAMTAACEGSRRSCTLVEVALDGSETPLPGVGAGGVDTPRYSPDGARIAYGHRGTNEIRIYEMTTGATTTFESNSGSPVWSTNGAYLYFASPLGGPGIQDGNRRLADASGPKERLWDRPGSNSVADVSSGDSIVVVRESGFPGSRGPSCCGERVPMVPRFRGLPDGRVEGAQRRDLRR